MNETIGVVLFQLGGPDSLTAIEPFLFNLFNDPDIINFPLSFLVRKQLARLISRKRASYVAHHYSLIGGKSPIGEITARQATALQEALKSEGTFRVVVAMRYWRPATEDAISELQKEKVTRVILLPLYPHYSVSTTGSSLNEWEKHIEKLQANFKSVLIHDYANNPGYIGAIVERIRECLERFPASDRKSVHLLFSAHGTPMKLVRNGDPYRDQIATTKQAVLDAGMFDLDATLSFQSRVGPQKWLQPFTSDTVQRLGKEGIKNLLVIPISFVSDHIETLYELNVEVRELAEQSGIRQFEVMEGLNTSKLFITTLKKLVLDRIAQAQFIES